ncbi:MAG: hypothetical protein A2X01_15210 [Bacteroidetes bacterium GWF2_35_48]|nr:MAG: hypothetical protein A2X01_15210 [Bacteroidetes bacterium GWF2_35_48]
MNSRFFSRITANGTCAGTCFIYLRPTAMPVGLAGLNKNKIGLSLLVYRFQMNSNNYNKKKIETSIFTIYFGINIFLNHVDYIIIDNL